MRTKTSRTEEEWQEIVKAHEKSGKSVSQFCLGTEFTDHQLRYWRKKFGILSKKKVSQPNNSGFVSLKPIGRPQPTGNIVIRYKSGTELELPANWNLSELITLIKLEVC